MAWSIAPAKSSETNPVRGRMPWLREALGHDVIIHHESTADVDHHRFAHEEPVSLVGADRLQILLVDVEDQHRSALSHCGGFRGGDQAAAHAATLEVLMHVELVEFELVGPAGAVIRSESRKRFADIGEIEPGAFLGDEAP